MNSLFVAPVRLNPSQDSHNGRRFPRRIREVTQLFRCGSLAVSSLFACVPMLLAKRPETPLRVLCISSFEYLARLQGRRLDHSGRIALAYACDFGALRNDFYDQGRLNRNRYRELRSGLRRLAPESATRRYIRDLRRAERSRPEYGPDGFAAGPAVEYRNRVLVLSLVWLQTISRRSLEPHLFQALVALVGLVQLVDDLLDWKDDCICGRPTYVTAFVRSRARPSQETIAQIHRYANFFRSLLAAAFRRHPELAPLTLAGGFVWLLAVALIRIRFPQ